jgi:hypothetical protein
MLVERGCDATVGPSVPVIPIPAAALDLMGFLHLAFLRASRPRLAKLITGLPLALTFECLSCTSGQLVVMYGAYHPHQ